jgi:hypothetical protein
VSSGSIHLLAAADQRATTFFNKVARRVRLAAARLLASDTADSWYYGPMTPQQIIALTHSRLAAVCRRNPAAVAAMYAPDGVLVGTVAQRIKQIWRVIERDGQEPQPGDPTPQEIAERSAEVRQRWTPHDWRVRSGAAETPPEPQTVKWIGTWHD